VLTADQHDEFRATGLLWLGGAFPRAAAEAMCGRLWEFLASQQAIHRDEPSTWTVEHPARFQHVTHSGAFRAVGGGPLCAALDALLGPGQWARPRWWGRPLVTFPKTARGNCPPAHGTSTACPYRPGRGPCSSSPSSARCAPVAAARSS
jgi:hypothetical protein